MTSAVLPGTQIETAPAQALPERAFLTEVYAALDADLIACGLVIRNERGKLVQQLHRTMEFLA